MKTLALACSITLVVALPLPGQTVSVAHLPKLTAEAAKYESGQNVEPLQKIEQLLRDSAAKPALREELETAMVKMLAPSSTFEARRFACQILAVVGTDASLPALAELLKSDETVGIACLALSNRRSPKGSETLRNVLPSSRGQARLQIIGAIGNHQDADSVKALAELARNADAAVANAAIVALSKIGSAPAHDAIIELRKEARPAQAVLVTEATLRMAEQLAAAGDAKAASALYTEMLQSANSPNNLRRGALAALLQLDEDGGQQRILDTIGGGDPSLTAVAIARVASLKSRGDSAEFAAVLPKLSPSARVWMIEALAARGDATARLAVRNELSATDAGIRRAAVLAVGRLDDASAVPLLAKTLAGANSPGEFQDIELALANLRGGDATDQALVAALNEAAPYVKVHLIPVLARRGSRLSVPALLAEAGGSELATARAAFQALGKIATAEDTPALLEKLVGLKAPDAQIDAERAAARVLAKIPDNSRRSEPLRAMLAKSTDVTSRCSLLRLLPATADADALAAVVAAAQDKEPKVRDTALRALEAWPDASAWDALLAVVRSPTPDVHPNLAFRALVRLAAGLNANPDAALIGRYRQLFDAVKGNEDLTLILGALGGAGHPDALELALPLIGHPFAHAEAKQAVKNIATAIKDRHPEPARKALEQLQQAK